MQNLQQKPYKNLPKTYKNPTKNTTKTLQKPYKNLPKTYKNPTKTLQKHYKNLQKPTKNLQKPTKNLQKPTKKHDMSRKKRDNTYKNHEKNLTDTINIPWWLMKLGKMELMGSEGCKPSECGYISI